jgi:uncharacterized protein
MKNLILKTISFYRKHFPKAASCRFTPSCSTYAYQVIEKDGALKGLLKASVRLLKCNSLFTPVVGTYDPVN